MIQSPKCTWPSARHPVSSRCDFFILVMTMMMAASVETLHTVMFMRVS